MILNLLSIDKAMDTRKSWSERLGGNEIGIDADLDGRIEKKGTRATQLSLDLDESKLHEKQVQVIHGAKRGEDIFIKGPTLGGLVNRT